MALVIGNAISFLDDVISSLEEAVTGSRARPSSACPEEFPSMSQPTCYAYAPANQPGNRIVLITFRESGYNGTTLDQNTMTEEEGQDLVTYMNDKLGVPPEVAESALRGSMFGWHIPGAAPAITHFSLLG